MLPQHGELRDRGALLTPAAEEIASYKNWGLGLLYIIRREEHGGWRLNSTAYRLGERREADFDFVVTILFVDAKIIDIL